MSSSDNIFGFQELTIQQLVPEFKLISMQKSISKDFSFDYDPQDSICLKVSMGALYGVLV